MLPSIAFRKRNLPQCAGCWLTQERFPSLLWCRYQRNTRIRHATRKLYPLCAIVTRAEYE
jgi:hypothetical protein